MSAVNVEVLQRDGSDAKPKKLVVGKQAHGGLGTWKTSAKLVL